eukprot:GEMP01042144.1.p1 GENE.GEMP01042144.1~~GEMP01042144.1.p1  ORF type:complete len:389 (+),score=55.80 GEMP01042144.1:251-1417(+)
MISARYFASLALWLDKSFCGNHEPAILHDESVDTSKTKEASGLFLSDAYLYTFSDSPLNEPYVWAINKTNGVPVRTIKITGITNQRFNGGYGDWEAGVFAKCTSNPEKKCLFIGDIGHNCARMERSTLRTKEQMPRLIEIEEPTDEEFKQAKGDVIEKAGKEYPFTYPNEWLFDAEAMTVDNEGKILLITKGVSGGKFPYSWVFEFPTLTEGKAVMLIEKAVLKVQYSEVTDATNTGDGLALRTYQGINWYKWDEICTSKYETSGVFHSVQKLSKNHGFQEAIAYDIPTKKFYLLGEDKATMHTLDCAAVTTGESPKFQPECKNKFGSDADPKKQPMGEKCRLKSSGGTSGEDGSSEGGVGDVIKNIFSNSSSTASVVTIAAIFALMA